ncbi:MAG: Uma2 family endonuclease [Thermoguttaceae bacterium]
MSTLAAKPQQRYSYADYLTWLDDVRREIIDGVMTLMNPPAPSWDHAEISVSISSNFYQTIKQHRGKCKVFHAPFDVRLPRNGETNDNEIYTVVQPDVCVICDLSKKYDRRGCIGAPDLVVEILSPSTMARDYRVKFDLYERSGVSEYWIVNPFAKSIEIFVLHEDGCYHDGTVYDGDNTQVKSILFPEVIFDLNEFFE